MNCAIELLMRLGTRKIKVVGVILTPSPTECHMVYKIWVLAHHTHQGVERVLVIIAKARVLE